MTVKTTSGFAEQSIRESAMQLGMVPAAYASPDPSTLATIPKGGVNLSYMGHAEVTLALIDVDPAWTWEPVAIDPETGGPKISLQGKRLVLWGYLEVLGVRRLCVGTCDNNKGDPEKELIGDLLRNGAMRFGIGTKLWSKATTADPAGSSHAGGYDRDEPTYSAAAISLYRRIAAAAGTPLADELKAAAVENGARLTADALDRDHKWAELVTAILDGAA